MQSPTPVSFLVRLQAGWWYIWGLSLCYSGNRSHERSFYESGIAAFQRALKLSPNFAQAYYRRGLIRGRELGEYRAAISDLSKAIELRPDWAEPYLQRGLFHRFHHNPQEAYTDLERYVGLASPGYWHDEAERQLELLRKELADSSE